MLSGRICVSAVRRSAMSPAPALTRHDPSGRQQQGTHRRGHHLPRRRPEHPVANPVTPSTAPVRRSTRAFLESGGQPTAAERQLPAACVDTLEPHRALTAQCTRVFFEKISTRITLRAHHPAGLRRVLDGGHLHPATRDPPPMQGAAFRRAVDRVPPRREPAADGRTLGTPVAPAHRGAARR
jgi:hypothetical protein